jgi:glutamine synthetase
MKSEFKMISTSINTEKKIRVLFCDQLNLARGKYLPESFAQKGEAMLCKGVYSITYSRDLIDAPGGGLSEGLPDVEMRFDPKNYRTSWDDNTSIALADVYEHGQPYALCGRSALKKAIAGWQKHELNPMIGLEGEAFVLQKINGKLEPYDTPGSYVYGTGPFNDPEGLMDDIWELAAQCNIPIESLNAEFDAPQFEMTLKYGDALKACDDFFLFRNLAREVLYKKGYLLSFLPKPLENQGGSGLHINISFLDKNGDNALADGINKNELSALTQGCIAGLLQHHESLGAIVAPTVNSYERLKPASMCGYWANWGHDHRAVAVRISGEAGPGARIEYRVGDCAASPYFAVAAVLQAALLGYEKQYPLPPEESKDGFEEVSVERHIAGSLSESIAALQQDQVLIEQIGNGLIANYVAIKQAEINELADKSFAEIVDYYAYYI